jgi:hypothetical protein
MGMAATGSIWVSPVHSELIASFTPWSRVVANTDAINAAITTNIPIFLI